MDNYDVISSIDVVSTGHISPCKKPRISSSNVSYCPEKMHIVKVLRNDVRGKCICLHVKFSDSLEKDAIVVLEKSPFPDVATALCDAQCGRIYVENSLDKSDSTGQNSADFPIWDSSEVTNNDIYHRFVVNAGLEKLNSINMTVIHPAQPEHFAKYSASRRRLIYESPEMYTKVIVPFLFNSPKDLTWVDNILEGKAETERVLFSNCDPTFGFTLVLDYRWDGRRLSELHCLGLAKSTGLTCLRDLNATHVPMLKEMLLEGRKCLVDKYGGAGGGDCSSEGEPSESLHEDQIIAYFHYPPTFYRLHMHFIHVDGAADGGTQTGKAHLAEDVISNLELKGDFYSTRTMPIYLHENHAFLNAIRSAE